MRQAPTVISLSLRGAGGERVDFARAARSHGLTDVAPFAVDTQGRQLATVVRLSEGPPRAVTLRRAGTRCRARVAGPRLDRDAQNELRVGLRRVLALEDDLSPFYASIEQEPLLAWARVGAGRIVRSQTVFEDVIRTLCTTNCAFSATRRMITTTVEELGEPTVADDETSAAAAFPTPEQISRAGVGFFRDRARAGYRAEHIVTIANRVTSGELDLEALRPHTSKPLDDEDAHARLLELPGVGPYAAAHAMMLMGRHSRLILDSWSRPAYGALVGKKLDDRAITRRFAPFGAFAGLAFWLVVTKSWIEQPKASPSRQPEPV